MSNSVFTSIDFLSRSPQRLSIEDIAELLDQTNWALEFSWNDLLIFAKYIAVYRIESDQFLFQEGDPGVFLGVIYDGNVAILKTDHDGVTKELAALDRGKSFGEMSVIDHQPRSATAVTRSITTVLILTVEQVQRMEDEQPGLVLKLLFKLSRQLCQRLRKTSGSLVDYLHNSL